MANQKVFSSSVEKTLRSAIPPVFFRGETNGSKVGTLAADYGCRCLMLHRIPNVVVLMKAPIQCVCHTEVAEQSKSAQPVG